MLAGLAVLRLLEGEGLGGWLLAGGIACVGLLTAIWQHRVVRRAMLIQVAGDGTSARQPGRAIRWSVGTNALAAIVIAMPVAGIALMLILGALVGWVLG